jgi:ribosome recycling factor
MIPELIKDAEEKMKKAIEATRHEFSQVRTGRANPGILEHLKVDMYGSSLPLNQVAAVSVPEPRQLLITPFDRTALAHIEKAIMKSDVGMTPNNDGTGIRLNIPALTEQRRKDLIKQVSQKAEQGKASVRTVRQEAIKKLSNARKDKENPISETEEKRAAEQVQKLTDKSIAEVDALTKAKEADLMEV